MPTGAVALIRGEGEADVCIALRTDIDALPVQEETDFLGEQSGAGHDARLRSRYACVHDAGRAAKHLCSTEINLPALVKLIFQPSERILSPEEPKSWWRRGNGESRDAIFGMHLIPDEKEIEQ